MLMFLSCTDNHSEPIDFSRNKAFPIVALPDNTFYSIVPLDSPYYKIRWGNKYGDTLLTDTTFSVLGSGPVGYLTTNKNAIFLQQECGTNCTFLVVLPFSKTAKPKLFFECIAIDTTNNLVAYVTEDDSSFIAIENIMNGKKMSIYQSDICQSAVKIGCVDSCFFESDKFYLRWSKDNSKNLDKPAFGIRKYLTREIILD